MLLQRVTERCAVPAWREHPHDADKDRRSRMERIRE
jgi:hypothetical protein